MYTAQKTVQMAIHYSRLRSALLKGKRLRHKKTTMFSVIAFFIYLISRFGLQNRVITENSKQFISLKIEKIFFLSAFQTPKPPFITF